MRNTRWLSLLILCTGYLLIVIDMTIVNVALPSIQRDLGFSPAGLAWVINAYLIAFAGFLLLAGRLGDLFGRKRVYLIGLVTAALSARLLESDRGIGIGRGADVLGAALVTAALMLGVYTIVESSVYGLGSLHTIVFGGIALALLGAFVARQALARNPLLPLGVFASRKLSASNVVQALMTAAFFGFFFMGSLDLEGVLGYGPMRIGLSFLPGAGGL